MIYWSCSVGRNQDDKSRLKTFRRPFSNPSVQLFQNHFPCLLTTMNTDSQLFNRRLQRQQYVIPSCSRKNTQDESRPPLCTVDQDGRLKGIDPKEEIPRPRPRPVRQKQFDESYGEMLNAVGGFKISTATSQRQSSAPTMYQTFLGRVTYHPRPVVEKKNQRRAGVRP
jgi:hypothetical protein